MVELCVSLIDVASEDYFDLARKAWGKRLISSSDLHKRLRVLDELRSPDRSWTYKPVWIRRSSLEGEEHFEGGLEGTCYQVADREIDNFEDRAESKPILHCIVKLDSNKWEFHKGDPDPNPSIPHGHAISNSNRKLDPYLGYIFVGKNPDGRLSKFETIKLWNDDRFRQFAAEALEHFIAVNPRYTFRVSNPRQLPKKR